MPKEKQANSLSRGKLFLASLKHPIQAGCSNAALSPRTQEAEIEGLKAQNSLNNMTSSDPVWRKLTEQLHFQHSECLELSIPGPWEPREAAPPRCNPEHYGPAFEGPPPLRAGEAVTKKEKEKKEKKEGKKERMNKQMKER